MSSEEGHQAASLEALEELVRQGERLIEGQLKATEEQDRKSQHWMVLSAAVLATAAAVAGLNPGMMAVPWLLPYMALLALALILTGVAFALFSRAYSGHQGDEATISIGWDPAVINAAAAEGDSLRRIHLSTIAGVERWYAENSAFIAKSAQLRRRGRVVLIWAGAALAAAFLYSIGVISLR